MCDVMFWDLLSEKNNLQLQIIDFEDDESIKALKIINTILKSKTKSSKIGFCKQCGSYHLVGWGGYGRKVRHMYIDS